MTEQDEEKRRGYAGIALVFADLAGCLETWQHALEDWNVERSRVTLEWEARGEARATLQTKRKDLLRTLQVRFGGPVPADVAQVIDNQADLATLDSWFDRALTAGGLNDMRPLLGLNGA